MTGKGGDYEGWILRLIDKPEDILFSFSQISWLRFAADKIEEATGQGITKGQIDSLLEYRDRAFMLPEEIGYRIQRSVRYRDERGRWTKDVTARPVERVIFRGEGVKFTSRAKVDTALRSYIDSQGVRKKPKVGG